MRRFVLAVVALIGLSTLASAAATDTARDQQWALDRIGADAARRAGTGEGVIVAVIDTGVDLAHEDLAGQLVPGWDFVDDDATPQDVNGHGTHVAGVIAAATGNGRGVAGVAPGAKVMPLRVLDADGAGSIDDVVAAVRWAVDHGADVVNLSLSEDATAILGQSFSDTLREAWDAGVVPVVAAGNEQLLAGPGFDDEPALVVTATDRNDEQPSYATGVGRARWGMAAPGGELPDVGGERGMVFSTYWVEGKTNQYARLAGTSQAAPHVAGAAAVLLSTGRFTPAQVVDRLLATAVDLGAEGTDPEFGAGRLDLDAATTGVNAASTGAPATAPATSSTVPATTTTSTPSTAPTTTVQGGEQVAGPAPVIDVPPANQVPESENGHRGLEGTIAAGLVALVGWGLWQERAELDAWFRYVRYR